MAVSRVCKRRPEAHRGGRPASVSALRTARRYPRSAVASASAAPFQGARDGAHPAPFLLAQHLGVAIRREDRLGRLPQIMGLAQPLGHVRPGGPHRVAERRLAVGNGPAKRHGQRGGDLAQQRGQLGLGAAEQAARRQHRARQASARHPQHLVPDIRPHAIARQDHLLLPRELFPQAGPVGRPQRHQFLVPLEQIGHTALGEHHATGAERPMALRHAAVLAIAQRAHQRDAIQPERAVRQRPATLLLGPRGPPIPGAGRSATQAHHQD